MKIELHEIPVHEIADGYIENEENGVLGYGGKLDIRPAFQREFIYKDKERDEVIRSMRKNFPLNVMYWVKNDKGNFEMLDGQQRTISVCRYVHDIFGVAFGDDYLKFNNLTTEEQNQILNYKLMIYFCEGSEREKLDWFEIVNIAGERLTRQETRNAIYSGTWLTDAKKYFSRNNCVAENFAGNYMKGTPIRQDYLETVIEWIADYEGFEGDSDKKITSYMSTHKRDSNCGEMWLYFQNVINWVKMIFSVYRKEMKGIEWGIYYNKYHDKKFNSDELEKRIQELIDDDDVNTVSGIYKYLLEGNEKYLNLRAFTKKDARAAYERQKGICKRCGKHFEFDAMQADHIIAWSKGGHTTPDNCQMLCKKCNASKGAS